MIKLLPTTIVGSYVQPDWLVDRELLKSRTPPRFRATEIWRVPDEYLAQAQDDATVLAIRDQERAGIDIVTDGEIRRESYSNRLAMSLDGIDKITSGTALGRTGTPDVVPKIIGKIMRKDPIEVNDVKFLRANTDHVIKITLPGPFTMTQQSEDNYYGNDETMAFDYAIAVNAEIKDLFEAGADIVQLDEPYMQARPDKAADFAVEAINKAVSGVSGTTALHMCFGYAHVYASNGLEKETSYAFLEQLNRCHIDQISIEAAQPKLDLSILRELPNKTIILGVIDNGDSKVESPETVASRIDSALRYVDPERLVLAPDCGMKYMDRDLAFAKLSALSLGASLVRDRINI